MGLQHGKSCSSHSISSNRKMARPFHFISLIVVLFLLIQTVLPFQVRGDGVNPGVRHPSERKVEVVFSPTHFTDASFTLDATLYPMRLSDGSRRMCLLPSDDAAVEDRLMRFHEDSKARHGTPVPQHIVASLRAELTGKCFQMPAGWWTYELCWEKMVRQVHIPKENEVEIILGRYPTPESIGEDLLEDDASASRSTSAAVPLYGHDHRGAYVSTVYTGGAMCETMPDPRIVEVRLYCGTGDMRTALNVVEVGTCKYLALLFVPEACAFNELEEPSVDRRVVCYPL